MKIEITLKVDVEYLDKITRVMTAVEHFAPGGSVLRVKVDGQIQQKTRRNGNRWEAVR